MRFYEVDESGEPVWEDWARFNETDVHHQYAIAMKTPPYRERNIRSPVSCLIALAHLFAFYFIFK